MNQNLLLVLLLFLQNKNKNNLMYKNMLCQNSAIINTNYSKRNKIKNLFGMKFLRSQKNLK